jgi:hypothetical protein
MYNTYQQVQVVPYIDERQKAEILRIINEEFDAMYRPNLWCGPCVIEMLVKAFKHLDGWYQDQQVAKVQEKIATVALIEEVKEVKKTRRKKAE